MRHMEREPFAKEEDVAARVLRAGLVARVRSALDAYQLLANLDLELKQRLPIVALRELASVAGSNPQARLTYLRRLAQLSASARGDALVHAVGGLDGNVAAERTIAQALPFATSSRSLVAWSTSLERRGRVEWARELAFVATKVAPNLPESWEALATARDAVMLAEKKAGKPATDDPSHAGRARERALALRRGDAGKKAEIAYRDGVFEGKSSTVKEKGADEAYLMASNTITERAKATPAKIGEAFERNLHFQRVVTYNDDRRVSQLIHQAREIVVEPRTQQELYERNIPYEGDEVELVFARVHRKDGTVAQPEEQSSVGAYIKWPQLRTGDIVEYAVRSWTSQPVGRRGDPPFYFIDYVGASPTRPVLFNEVIVIAPENDQLGVDVINGKADRASDVVKDGKRVQTFTWDKPPTVADEPLAPAGTENLPIVVGSTFRSWDDFRAWYRNAIEGFSEPDEQVKRLAAELTKGKKTEKEKLEALFNYVADDIRYVNYTSGEYWLPNRPQICLSRKQGDCDDKAILLIALLKSIGVTATPVLVQTRMTAMPSVLMGTKAAAPLFDHGIAFLPGKNGAPGTWLDATSPESRIGPLPSMDARAKALFIYEGEAKIIDTPPGAVADNGVTSTWEVALDASGGATIKGNEKHVGDWAFELRRNLKEEGARGQWVESYLSRWVPTMDLAPEIPYSPDAGTLSYSVKAEGFARSEGDEWALASLGAYSFMANFASLPQRTLPVVLPPFMAPSHQRRTMTFTLPAGFEWKPLPPGGEAKGGAFGLAKVSFKPGRAPRSIVVETEIVIDKSTITVAEYPAFRKWLESVDALIRQTARYRATGGAKADANKGAFDDDAALSPARPITSATAQPNTRPGAGGKPSAPGNTAPKAPAPKAPAPKATPAAPKK
jgi:transglutaminase-like putative cysteine protease